MGQDRRRMDAAIAELTGVWIGRKKTEGYTTWCGAALDRFIDHELQQERMRVYKKLMGYVLHSGLYHKTAYTITKLYDTSWYHMAEITDGKKHKRLYYDWHREQWHVSRSSIGTFWDKVNEQDQEW